jgi:predicted transcriptional regulator of viral defense system
MSMCDEIAAIPDRACLFGIAATQQGYFTAAQARDCGYSPALLAHHARGGRFLRVRRGLYRFREYPSSPREEVMAAWLAAGPDRAVVSHESALDLLDLADVIRNAIHLTVPRSRRGLVAPRGVLLHTTTWCPRPDETTEREGIRLTGPQRTILDAAEWGTAPEQIVLAIGQALARGWLTEDELRRETADRPERVARLVATALTEVGLARVGAATLPVIEPSDRRR